MSLALHGVTACAAGEDAADLRGSIVVVKYGGAAMTTPELADSWARDVVLLQRAGVRILVVHGGGPALTRVLARMGIDCSFEGGHRVTGAEAAEVAEMVLSGGVNKRIVSRLARAGGRAIGLSGTDAGMVRVRPHRPAGRELGFVGEVESVDPAALHLLLDHGYVPVLSSTAADASGQPFNINADLVAGAVAAALGATRLVFLSDVAGFKDAGTLVPVLRTSDARRALEDGTATGGMRPKLEGALLALARGVRQVHLADGTRPHALLLATRSVGQLGTLVVPDETDRAIAASETTSSTAPAWAGTLAARGLAHLLPTYARYPIEIVDGRGCRVVDSRGKSYLDFVAGIGVNALGHGHPALVAAVRSASGRPFHVSNLYWTEPMVRLAERLTCVAGMDRAFFCNSGAEAIEAALKLARKARPGRSKIVVFERSFHGRTLGALSATAQPQYQEGFGPLVPGIVAIPFGDLDAVSAAVDGDTAAVLVEPIQGEGGVRTAPDGWLAHMREACDRAGALLIFDEVQCGVGRTGTFFAYQGEDVLPDAVASAKALAGGLPIGALMVRGSAADALEPGQHGSTFGGSPLVASAAHAVLDVVLADGFLDDVRAKGERLGRVLDALVARHPLAAQVRGRGLLRGIALTAPVAPRLVAALHDAGMLAVPAGNDVLRLLPPLVTTPAEIDEAATLLERAFHATTPSAVAAARL